ncbi:MAG: winged helix-turn-helix transcriptional regulator [Candidatus Lokiarchaeota archaeon]|nr:winged helix-turn-helix transcriptional regulator [Candidatus Lokiarchaeota archaeon]
MSRVDIDQTDLDIMAALDDLGAKASAREIYNYLETLYERRESDDDVPKPRTIRYRLKQLYEKELLHSPRIMTHERKLGLGEHIIELEEVPLKTDNLLRIIEQIPSFYWWTAVYGKYNGYQIHAMYPLTMQHLNKMLLDEMLDAGLIRDFHILDIVDYELKQTDFKNISSDNSLNWNWNSWPGELSNTDMESTRRKLNFTEATGIAQFDYQDVMILEKMLQNSRITQRKLAREIGISEGSVSARIRRMEDEGIIKGYKPAYTPVGDPIYITLYIEIREQPQAVLAKISELPFLIGVSSESMNKHCLKMAISSEILKHFMQRLRDLRPYLTSYFLQYQALIERKSGEHQSVFDLFDAEKNTWVFPVEKYLNLIRSSVE